VLTRNLRCAKVQLVGQGRTYRLEVEGELGELVGRSFPRMRIFHRHGNTVLVGPVRDEAELNGMLQHFSVLGLKLKSVNTLDTVSRP
jgi:hypothetical protein